MKLVVEIDEGTYKDIKKGKIYSSIRDVPLESVNAIANGTPLPKGHGRIVDISQIECLKAIHDAKYGRIPWSEAIKRIKNSAPTLVEADTESEEWA